MGARIFAQLNELSFLLPALRSHHERWDGTGYPDGLRGKEIPLLARLIAIGDAFDAMTDERTYRRTPLTFNEACEELRREAGGQFDPELVEVFTANATPDLVARPSDSRPPAQKMPRLAHATVLGSTAEPDPDPNFRESQPA